MSDRSYLLAQTPPNPPAGPPAPPSDSYLVASIILGGVSLLLLGLEMILPTSGMLALLCGTCLVASVVAMFMWNATAGLLLLLGYTIAAPFVFFLFLKVWSKSPIVRAYALNDDASKPVGAEAPIEGIDPEAEGADDLLRFRRLKALADAIGKRAVTETPLRPAGFITLDGHRVDAIAENGFVEAGVSVRVVAVVDGALKVRADA
ncbi:MAG: hypothetical protein JNM94_11690 [Phycisphaerae bacterium]|nr:hypothetical protein [Phycisphaerae bacterium]